MMSPKLDDYQRSLGELPGVVRPARNPPVLQPDRDVDHRWWLWLSIACITAGLALLSLAFR